MTTDKSDPRYLRFMKLYASFVHDLDADPNEIEELAINDSSVKEMCLDLRNAAVAIFAAEKSARAHFTTPVNPEFIESRRDYEERWSEQLDRIYWKDYAKETGLDFLAEPFPQLSPSESIKVADGAARYMVMAIGEAIALADDTLANDGHIFSEEDAHWVEDGVEAWRTFTHTSDHLVLSILRRQSAVEFINVPTHVAHKHGSAETLSLYTLLRQAQEAFVCGLDFAAIALLRALMELVLVKHYEVNRQELDRMIDASANKLPKNLQPSVLHRLRQLGNWVVHSNQERVSTVDDLEQEILAGFQILRRLIEEAPSPTR